MATTKRTRVKRTRAGGQWTEAKYWAFVRSLLRKGWLRYPVRSQVLNNSRKVVTGQRHRFEYLCASCGSYYKGKEVEVDHIVPCGNLDKDPGRFIQALYCEPKDLQVLCKPCHKVKTEQERKR